MSNGFANLTPFNIPDFSGGVAGLAISTVNVHNAHFIVSDIEVLMLVTHTFPDDLDMVLVAPDGVHNLVFWSDAGGGNANAISNLLVGVADAGVTQLPDSTLIASSLWKPANWGPSAETPAEFGLSPSFTLNSAAPTGGATFGSSFGGINPAAPGRSASPMMLAAIPVRSAAGNCFSAAPWFH